MKDLLETNNSKRLHLNYCSESNALSSRFLTAFLLGREVELTARFTLTLAADTAESDAVVADDSLCRVARDIVLELSSCFKIS